MYIHKIISNVVIMEKIKYYFLYIYYTVFRMPKKILYDSDDAESIDDSNSTVIEAPIIEVAAPIIENSAPDLAKSSKVPIVKSVITCEYCKKTFSRQTILNKHLKELRCKAVREIQQKKEQEMTKKEIELKALQDKIFLQVKIKEERQAKKLLKDQQTPSVKKVSKPKEEVKPKEMVKPLVQPPVQPLVKPPAVRQDKPKYIINF